MTKVCYICNKKFQDKFADNKKYCKVIDHCYYTGDSHSICNLKFSIPKYIHVVFCNELFYDYYFIIKEIAKKFEGKLSWLVENT